MYPLLWVLGIRRMQSLLMMGMLGFSIVGVKISAILNQKHIASYI